VGVKDPPLRVGRFLRERELCSLAVELSAPGDQLADPSGSLLHEDANRLPAAEAVARPEGVLEVDGYLVLVGERNGDAALGIFAAALGRCVLCDDEDAAVAGGSRGPQARHAAADDEEVGGEVIGHINCGMRSAE
jgi:hypothetical protein